MFLNFSCLPALVDFTPSFEVRMFADKSNLERLVYTNHESFAHTLNFVADVAQKLSLHIGLDIINMILLYHTSITQNTLT